MIGTNLLEHVVDRPGTILRLRDATASHLIVPVPAHHAYHEDPIDTMYQRRPSGLASDVTAIAPALKPMPTGSIHVLGAALVREPAVAQAAAVRCAAPLADERCL